MLSDFCFHLPAELFFFFFSSLEETESRKLLARCGSEMMEKNMELMQLTRTRTLRLVKRRGLVHVASPSQAEAGIK